MRGTEGEFCDMWKEELAKSQTRGPMSKRALYPFLMKCLAEEGFFSEWRTPAEIAFEANKRVSRTWRPIRPSAVRRYMQKAGLVMRERKQNEATPYEYKLN
tara:strand:+ start:150 stop:452 length:303 start_codon:yes stop_codon:yes gene_type:complete